MLGSSKGVNKQVTYIFYSVGKQSIGTLTSVLLYLCLRLTAWRMFLLMNTLKGCQTSSGPVFWLEPSSGSSMQWSSQLDWDSICITCLPFYKVVFGSMVGSRSCNPANVTCPWNCRLITIPVIFG